MVEGLRVHDMLVKLADGNADRQRDVKIDLRKINDAIEAEEKAKRTFYEKPGVVDVIKDTINNIPGKTAPALAGGAGIGAYFSDEYNKAYNNIYTREELGKLTKGVAETQANFSKNYQQKINDLLKGKTEKVKGKTVTIPPKPMTDAARKLRALENLYKGTGFKFDSKSALSTSLMNVPPEIAVAAQNAGFKRPQDIKAFSDLLLGAAKKDQIKGVLRSGFTGGLFTDLFSGRIAGRDVPGLSQLLRLTPSTTEGKASVDMSDILRRVRIASKGAKPKINMDKLRLGIQGLSKGFAKNLPIKGVGWKFPALTGATAAVAANLPTLWNKHTNAHTSSLRESDALLNEVRKNYLARQEPKE